jgi:DNA-directed RNA polymerase specialized sigma24 family protein
MKILSDYISKEMKTLRKRLSGVVTNPTDRDDIIQEACVAILHAKPSLSEEDFPKYFTRVLFSKVAAYKNAQCDVTVLAGFVGREVAPDSNPLQHLMDEENNYLMPDLIKDYVTLAATQEALRLVYCEGCKIQVAADLVGMSRSSLDMANSRFKKAIYGLYEGMDT